MGNVKCEIDLKLLARHPCPKLGSNVRDLLYVVPFLHHSAELFLSKDTRFLTDTGIPKDTFSAIIHHDEVCEMAAQILFAPKDMSLYIHLEQGEKEKRQKFML